jgi:hypothetical protein
MPKISKFVSSLGFLRSPCTSLIITANFLVLTLAININRQAFGQSDVLLERQSCSSEDEWRSHSEQTSSTSFYWQVQWRENSQHYDDLRSNSDQISTNIQFVNRSSFTVKVYWIDYDGRLQHYFDLEPNEIREQQTFVFHPWLVTEDTGGQPCIGVFFPDEQPGTAIIDF